MGVEEEGEGGLSISHIERVLLNHTYYSMHLGNTHTCMHAHTLIYMCTCTICTNYGARFIHYRASRLNLYLGTCISNYTAPPGTISYPIRAVHKYCMKY